MNINNQQFILEPNDAYNTIKHLLIPIEELNILTFCNETITCTNCKYENNFNECKQQDVLMDFLTTLKYITTKNKTHIANVLHSFINKENIKEIKND